MPNKRARFRGKGVATAAIVYIDEYKCNRNVAARA